MCKNRNRSALVRELLSNNSLFGQLYEDKSLPLGVRDLIFFTTDLHIYMAYSLLYSSKFSSVARFQKHSVFYGCIENFTDPDYHIYHYSVLYA